MSRTVATLELSLSQLDGKTIAASVHNPSPGDGGNHRKIFSESNPVTNPTGALHDSARIVGNAAMRYDDGGYLVVFADH
jgi:hypothetical protein